LLSFSTSVRAQDPVPPAAEQAPVEVAPTIVLAPGGLDISAHVGVGLRTELIIDPNRAEPEDSPVYQMNNNLRPYISGQVHEYIKFEGNLDSDGTNIRVLDAVIKLELNDYVNLWTGHFLPPSDRANLSGPYFQNAWTYPTGVHIYPSQFAGRDDGLAFWGQINGGQLKYQLGLFGMQGAAPGGGTTDPRFSGRVTYNVLDPEPGYYNSSTYYGTKDILAIAAVLHYQPAPEGAPDSAADALWNLDALYENSFAGAGTLDVEAAFYGFGGADAGTSFSLLASFLFAGEVGIGQLQPMLRLQRAAWSDGDTFSGIVAPPGEDASLLTVDAGVHYVINGHNARLAATLQHAARSVADEDSSDTIFILGAQVQAF
jgi:hypothetical protein